MLSSIPIDLKRGSLEKKRAGMEGMDRPAYHNGVTHFGGIKAAGMIEKKVFRASGGEITAGGWSRPAGSVQRLIGPLPLRGAQAARL